MSKNYQGVEIMSKRIIAVQPLYKTFGRNPFQVGQKLAGIQETKIKQKPKEKQSIEKTMLFLFL